MEAAKPNAKMNSRFKAALIAAFGRHDARRE
jgi:hypothetical protein